MKRSTNYVALDIHQATAVASVREGSGRVIARSIFDTEESAILDFFDRMRRSVQVTFEEGTQAQWLHDMLAARVDRVLVCERRGEKKQGNKKAMKGMRTSSQTICGAAIYARSIAAAHIERQLSPKHGGTPHGRYCSAFRGMKEELAR